ncbi:tRNA 2-selenouridine(34) synthase MnmH [Desulfomarina profundi]|uniref:tRNA 2-selenouridine(34) synthase MnmH n=1 Tax=Desulfomarina profundi TaxID=2772557 RepID=A0A8D5JNM3_9BACT|nr:tRNA 2-selenouridine(34) synthase MnmH [Desulfomarina profundi]BCL62827.1 tRNA 2-selenouridine(34) synthase MnmH [Desulfomarina profundi]
MADLKKNFQEAILAPSRPVSLDFARNKGFRIIDVRSPGEFQQGTIPGAVNIPLFDDDERGVIGTLYRHAGHGEAVSKGFELVESNLATLVESFQPYRGETIVIFCARGGMRSRSVVNLLERYGYSVFQLEGGYKKYRHEILARLESFAPKLIVLHGLTGCGKTRILQELDNSIDLEDLARHRSSLFGAIDREPRNQRAFESHLVQALESLGPEPYFIEGESRKIGRVFIPGPLAMAMKHGVLVLVKCSLETRVKRIIADYPVEDEKTLEQIETILNSLRQKMGNQAVNTMCSNLRQGRLEELVRQLLVDYYDRRYGNCMSDYSYSLEISSENISQAARRLQEFRIFR